MKPYHHITIQPYNNNSTISPYLHITAIQQYHHITISPYHHITTIQQYPHNQHNFQSIFVPMKYIAKALTKQAVKETAEELMAQNNTTTTLDVKKSLRGKGYLATQDEVSSLMTILGDEELWYHTIKNGHKVYWK
jgi:hypothetical protein